MNVLVLNYKSHMALLHRVGRCLSFGCSTQQTLQAAALSSRLTRAWPSAYLARDGYIQAPYYESDQSRFWRQGKWGRVAVGAVGKFSGNALVGYLLGKLGREGMKKGIERFPPHLVFFSVRAVPPEIFRMDESVKLSSLKSCARFGHCAPPQRSRTHRNPSAHVPPAWYTSDGSVNVQSAVFSASLKPVAVVDQVLGLRDAKGPADIRSLAVSNPEALRTFIRESEGLMRRGRDEVNGLLKAVRDLEMETWDREDAVEDMGGSEGSKGKEDESLTTSAHEEERGTTS